MNTVGEIVRKAEDDYISGNTQISDYVDHSLRETVEKTEAYLNSKHITGEFDSLERKKPFFNICTSAVNIWFRATDIDRSNIHLKAVKTSDIVPSFLITARLQDWMKREKFGHFLNEWGRTLAKNGSAIVKFVKNKEGLHVSVIPWTRVIVDPVEFDANPKIEVLELTESQLRKRVDTHGYDEVMVEELCEAIKARETLGKIKKDNKSNYIKLYEVHGEFPLSFITGKEKDEDTYTQQMHVISFVGIKGSGRNKDYQDFTLYAGRESKDPYMLTHLIKHDTRTLSLGAVEYLFESQWMVNHSMKNIKDTLDIASRIIFQTADANFLNRNVLSNLETGQILIHDINTPLTKVDNSKTDIVSSQNYAVQWKQLGNEITGVSEAMLGAQPKSGTAWRQTEALLTESYSLFELMTENKGLHIEDMLRVWIIPQLKKELDTTEEISATLDAYGITQLDSMYIPREAIRRYNKRTVDTMLEQARSGQEIAPVSPYVEGQEQPEVLKDLQQLGGKRFYKPSEIDGETWKDMFKDFEWEVEVDITGEGYDSKTALETLNTVLRLVMSPGFEQSPKAQMIVGKALELTGAISPVEYNSVASNVPLNNNGAGGAVEPPQFNNQQQ